MVIFGGKIWQLENILLAETKKQAQKILKTIKPDLRKKIGLKEKVQSR